MDWDSPAFRTERNRNLLRWMKGDVDAVNCFLMVSNVAEVWDDIKDGDQSSESDTDAAFVDMMINMNDNEFFLANRQKITAALVITANGWLDANEMATSGVKDDRIKAYMLRNLGLELVPLFVYLTSGYKAMRKHSMEIRKYFTHETFVDWEKEHDAA